MQLASSRFGPRLTRHRARLLFEISRLSELAQPAARADLVALHDTIAGESMYELRLSFDRRSMRAASTVGNRPA